MKSILTLLILNMFLYSCAAMYDDDVDHPPFYSTGGETVADGLKWHDVVRPFYVDELSDGSNSSGGTYINVNHNYIEGDSTSILGILEFDDEKDYVGSERGRIVEGQQKYIYQFEINVQYGYTFKVKQGSGLTAEQFEEAADPDGHYNEIYWEGSEKTGQTRTFHFNWITGYDTLPIGTILAELEVYKSNDLGKALGSFYLVL